jgi:hypothetical protein
MGTFGSRPLVTARVIRVVRFSWSSSISRSFFATSASILTVSRSRNAAMARCSWADGIANRPLRIASPLRPNRVIPFAAT